jgi:hypothetical protein
MIRGITGTGEGNGPFISIHDGFNGTAAWAGFLPGSDRIILDTHPYFAFDQQPNDAPIATSEDPASAGGIWPHQACSAWGPAINTRYGFLLFSVCLLYWSLPSWGGGPDFLSFDQGTDVFSCAARPHSV